MILKGSQRGGAKQLGLHLLKTAENEHVEIHDVRGFMTDDVVGALREAEAVSKGTKCRQFLFSVSLNPPESESVRIETFEQAIAAIEEKHGLTDQPRVIVFHEKEGRRHCHAVWSRIDAETMTAKPLPFFKNKLMEVSKQLYLEHGWQMPRGLKTAQERLEALRKDQQQRPTVRVRQVGKDAISPTDRLQRLREGQKRKLRGPELGR
ncbi:relaxase/mobilization nuclease domain-containing protein [Tritonibacter mobilis]|uniref:relaxase/mobilization nuclease domain-containing protein n=1 Tax=Tritonibacter mobilis TaxID=379347 RepID=UPI001C09F2BE|nr:relaxase/mobilization nuclease domain-containing protein [Tritonibacter mobilis]MBU3036481.1 relaxase/mobilization nuclease domain-containing protein [Tritonibacter mobilis]